MRTSRNSSKRADALPSRRGEIGFGYVDAVFGRAFGQANSGSCARSHRLEVRPEPPIERSRLSLLCALGVPFAASRRGQAERLLLEKLLERCKERGYLKVRARARTDSTHVWGALRLLSKWERTAETMRAALNALASVDPEWLTEHADPEWFERYARRIEDQRLPKGKQAREEYLKTVGADGLRLLGQLDAPHTPEVLKEIAEVETLRRIWEQHYEKVDGRLRVLDPKEMPEGAHRIESPYEVEARYSTKRSMDWVGYKVHLTESCAEKDFLT
jgi:transposase